MQSFSFTSKTKENHAESKHDSIKLIFLEVRSENMQQIAIGVFTLGNKRK